MDALVQTILAEIPTSINTTFLLECVPRLIQEAQKLMVPGSEKKAAVIAALHQIVDSLKDIDTAELKTFIDVTVTPTVDLMVAAYNGTLTAPKNVEEVVQKVGCFLQSIQALIALVKKCKAPKVVVAPKVEAVLPKEETKAADVAETAEVVVTEAVKEEADVAAKAAELVKEAAEATEEV